MSFPRWKKVFRDIWGNALRTVLVVLSIAIGVAAIGIIASLETILSADLPDRYAQINPASGSISSSPFDDDLVASVRKMDGVGVAEGRYLLPVRLMLSSGDWLNIDLYAISDFTDIRINKFSSQSGAWPPGPHSMLLERAPLPLTGYREGESVLIQTPEGKQREVLISGLAYDISQPSGVLSNQAFGFISFDTLDWLGYPKGYNQLLFTVENNPLDRGHIQSVANEISDKFEKTGLTVNWVLVPDPGKHWFESYLAPMTAILGCLGILAVALSAFLVVNTILALIAQQVRQVGVMRAIGARRGQIIVMYLAMVTILGILSALIAIPVSRYGTQACLNLLAGIINFNPIHTEVPRQILILQIGLSLLVPILATMAPILTGTRITVREALADYGIQAGQFGSGWIDRLVGLVHGLPRPLLLSVRNTFRRKARLVLTLTALSLGSAIFIAVLGVYASLSNTLTEALSYYKFDVAVYFSHAYRADEIQKDALNVPGVTAAETWGVEQTRRVRADDSESDSILLLAPPVGTQLISPPIISGRWLLPEDDNAVVVNTDLTLQEPDIRVGQPITLMIDGKKTHWQVVGITRSGMTGASAYTNLPYFAQSLNQVGSATAIFIATDQHDSESLNRMAKTLESAFDRAGLRVSSTSKVSDIRASATYQFNVILVFLVSMALILALVGGIGLMGTMSINVLERTREIGVMRAIGASTLAILQIFLVEGITIGCLGWMIGALLAIPLNRYLGDLVGWAFMQTTLVTTYSVNGAFLWLGAMILISMAASFIPAYRASRYTVRDALSYE